MNLVQKAKVFATAAHAAVGQRRKYTNEPYIIHPSRVVIILSTVTDAEHVLAAGWLHDVVEDTAITLEDIVTHFGPDVADLVNQVTDVSKPEDGNRAVRKAIDKEHLRRNSSPEGATIKLADLIDNTNCIVRNDPKFAKVYLQEKRELLKVLTHGDKVLYDLALKQLSE